MVHLVAKCASLESNQGWTKIPSPGCTIVFVPDVERFSLKVSSPLCRLHDRACHQRANTLARNRLVLQWGGNLKAPYPTSLRVPWPLPHVCHNRTATYKILHTKTPAGDQQLV